MNPDTVSGLPMVGDGVSEGLVYFEILFPGVIIVLGMPGTLLHLVVQGRPEHRATEVCIMALKFTVPNEHGQGLVVAAKSIIDEDSGPPN